MAERRDSRGGSCENLLPQLLCPSDWIQDPASVAMGGDLDEWIAKMRNCELLPEHDLKHLCEYVQELMLEESTVQPCEPSDHLWRYSWAVPRSAGALPQWW